MPRLPKYTHDDIKAMKKDQIVITNPTLVIKIKELALQSKCRNHHVWAQEVLENFIIDCRAGRFNPDPSRFSNRNDVDEYELQSDVYHIKEVTE